MPDELQLPDSDSAGITRVYAASVGARRKRAERATLELKAAVMAMPMGQAPANQMLPIDTWSQLGRGCIAAWVDDAGRCCDLIAKGLEVVERARSEEALEALENALWRVDAAREKLEAVFALTFGVPSLAKYKQRSLRFEPNAKRISAKLEELGKEHEHARELARLGRELAEHIAATRRNQLSHQIAPIWEARELCWLDVAHVRRGSIVAWSGGPFYVERLLERGGNIGSETLWRDTTNDVGECFGLLVASMERMKQLVEAAAVLEPPQRVYRDDDEGGISLNDPRLLGPS